MKDWLIWCFILGIACLSVGYPTICIGDERPIEIIERPDTQKKILVKNLTNPINGELKNYKTFGLTIAGILIFCHISNDGTEPRVLCH